MKNSDEDIDGEPMTMEEEIADEEIDGIPLTEDDDDIDGVPIKNDDEWQNQEDTTDLDGKNEE